MAAGILTAVQRSFPAPPNDVLSCLNLDAILDKPCTSALGVGQRTDGIRLPEGASATAGQLHAAAAQSAALDANLHTPAGHAMPAAMPGLPQLDSAHDGSTNSRLQAQLQLNTAGLKQAVKDDLDAHVHSELYHMLAQCEADAAEWEPDGATMLTEAGHEQVLQALELTYFDLCYNFYRYESWERILSELVLAPLHISHSPLQCVISGSSLCGDVAMRLNLPATVESCSKKSFSCTG